MLKQITCNVPLSSQFVVRTDHFGATLSSFFYFYWYHFPDMIIIIAVDFAANCLVLLVFFGSWQFFLVFLDQSILADIFSESSGSWNASLVSFDRWGTTTTSAAGLAKTIIAIYARRWWDAVRSTTVPRAASSTLLDDYSWHCCVLIQYTHTHTRVNKDTQRHGWLASGSVNGDSFLSFRRAQRSIGSYVIFGIVCFFLCIYTSDGFDNSKG